MDNPSFYDVTQLCFETLRKASSTFKSKIYNYSFKAHSLKHYFPLSLYATLYGVKLNFTASVQDRLLIFYVNFLSIIIQNIDYSVRWSTKEQYIYNEKGFVILNKYIPESFVMVDLRDNSRGDGDLDLMFGRVYHFDNKIGALPSSAFRALKPIPYF